jgi:choline dehydrogenase-like flavoprotein
VVVVACQAIETARLLLLSTGPRHPQGLGNRNGLVGRWLLFCPDGAGLGDFPLAKFSGDDLEDLLSKQPHVNRTIQDWYVIDDPRLGPRRKGGSVDFLLPHANPVATAWGLAAWDQVEDGPLWGRALKDRMKRWWREQKHLRFEVFCDWLPAPDSRVTLDPSVTDRWGLPVARIRLWNHPRNRETARWLAERGGEVLRMLGAENVRVSAGNAASTNLVAGTCRFGDDPAASVLDRDCRVHDAENVFVTDGSFMPTGGSVPYTFTIYANAFRVADRIVEALGRRG